MKKITSFLLMLIFGITLSGCSNVAIKNSPKNITPPQKESMSTAIPENLRLLSLDIQEMTCGSCSVGIEYALKGKEGVIDAKILYPEGTGEVIYDSEKISSEELLNLTSPYPSTAVKDQATKQTKL